MVNYASSKEGADRVVAEITGKGGKADRRSGRRFQSVRVQRLFKETKKAFGSLDVLVNNAGVYKFAPIESVTEDEFHRQFNTNVLGLLLATREAVKYFGSEGGSVINIGSVASRIAPPVVLNLLGDQRRGGRGHRRARERTGPQKDPSQLHQPGRRRDRRRPHMGIIGSDFQKEIVGQTP